MEASRSIVEISFASIPVVHICPAFNRHAGRLVLQYSALHPHADTLTTTGPSLTQPFSYVTRETGRKPDRTVLDAHNKEKKQSSFSATEVRAPRIDWSDLTKLDSRDEPKDKGLTAVPFKFEPTGHTSSASRIEYFSNATELSNTKHVSRSRVATLEKTLNQYDEGVRSSDNSPLPSLAPKSIARLSPDFLIKERGFYTDDESPPINVQSIVERQVALTSHKTSLGGVLLLALLLPAILVWWSLQRS